MNVDQTFGIVRAALATLGGILVAKGLVDDATMQTAVGAFASLAVAIWSHLSNRTGKVNG